MRIFTLSYPAHSIALIIVAQDERRAREIASYSNNNDWLNEELVTCTERSLNYEHIISLIKY